MEVIYTGLHQTIDQIINTAMQEGVDVIGLSHHVWSHLPICEKLTKKMNEKRMDGIMVVVGGLFLKEILLTSKRWG